MILTLTKNRKDMNSKDISSFSTSNPFCWTCCFLEHQNRCIDAMMSSSRLDQMPFICWKCHLFGNSTWAILYSPLVLWLLFFESSNRKVWMYFLVLFQCRSGDKTTCNWCRISFHQLYFSVGGVIKYLPLAFVAGILFRTKPPERILL